MKNPKSKISATSESVLPNGDYPKTVVIVLDIHPDDPDRVIISREVTNLSGLELYGLLQVVTRAVEDQVGLPLSQRSDGITVTRQSEAKGTTNGK